MRTRLIAVSLLASTAFADDAAMAPFQIPNLPADVTIDGKIDESIWQQAGVRELSYVTWPDENAPSPVNTTLRIFESGDTLYLAFDAKDPNPNDIRAFYSDRDNIWSDDAVGVKLDTFNDSRLAYQFFVNPFGVQGDAIENEMTGQESDSWDAIWQSAGQITEDGYQVEMAIPLRILNFKESDRTQTWQAEFVRFYPRDERLRLSNLPKDRSNACTLCQLSPLQGFAEAEQGTDLTLVPTLVTSRSRSRDPAETLNWDYDSKLEPGLDIKWGVTPEMSLQATLNPDFSQVEADVAQLSINNTFTLFFPEQRPFFLENADYFASNYNLIYTRNVGAPDYGAKLTGRAGDHTLGVFGANDINTTFIVPGNIGSSIAELERESQNAALRYRYDASDNLSLGWVSTHRQADDYRNTVYGGDAKYRVNEQDTVRVQYVHSSTRYPNGLYQEFCDDEQCQSSQEFTETALRLQQTDIDDKAYRVDLNHDERDWFAYVSHSYQGKDFRADLGFESRSDFVKTVAGGGYAWYNESSWWSRFRLRGDWDITHNTNGELIERENEANITLDAVKQSYVQLGYVERQRVGQRRDTSRLAIDGNTRLYDEYLYYLFAEMRPNANWYMNLDIQHGEQIDFANDRLGDHFRFQAVADWNLGAHFKLKLRHTYRSMDAADAPLFTANLTDTRFIYQFDAKQYLRLSLIYSDIERNQANYLDDVTEQSTDLGTQLLYSYKVNPLTSFFVGYADHGFTDDVVAGYTRDEQSVFMKFSYAWML
ncbi:hypothetical protein HMF8227_01126 [Saliniradius amylolyticus]|uniref:Uncharacterized protein n=1 Tax=Saliniradius amylolyticus TaxID=2183582 RepID=A0A2S2E3K7_9ALTE|nr:carbohydrate binding family 9 domain-containing protein [Saliniradius amylolyticus]AWL11607.1 hypothetical protein HMF8227_01126 [Saliniradius amylolyticus]